MHRVDGFTANELAATLGLPAAELYARLGSSMDEAHRLGAAGTPAGTLILADEQTAGRGRGGKKWDSSPGEGLWMTLVERPESASGLDVLSLRLGLRIAGVLERLAGSLIEIKWPNDLFVSGRKLAGILVEARWRDQTVDWVAIGVGINITAPPGVTNATGLKERYTRAAVLAVVVPAVRAAAALRGPLSTAELSEFAARDYARGRAILQPTIGTAQGITPDGALVVRTEAGFAHFRGGSLVFAEEAK